MFSDKNKFINTSINLKAISAINYSEEKITESKVRECFDIGDENDKSTETLNMYAHIP